ncbi:DUF262 domain-containing HNH endonuclease family protein [Lactobacillus rodentium]|uniref:DUF262 domain-containing protein n=1 Tax=Lactobacillus rodentium TaxID=947835 RepID=A0A2Z6TA92_9LACO|nr:DUF262 domain-containing protein [Lactobacillus rodentium]MCR1894487.1 DUF262 domain-containing HNH endonuclease family protein [Lactobacillus rodentium]GBG04803.1 hypothetical protein LrDSM24759_07170 [Lactobacillus rodentium]
MKADSLHLFDFLGMGKTIFEIPVFQRNYEWSEHQCKQLFDDVVMCAREKHDHFIGTIVYVSETGAKMSHIYRIIDGQQRLTSLTLLLKALADSNEEISSELEDQYLINKYLEENNHYKLKPVAHDSGAFKAVMRGKIDECDTPSKIISNYKYFKEMIDKSNLSGSEIEEALSHLSLVYIELSNEVGNESPQLIFESLNSTGVSLSASDLVRNFLLMNLDGEAQARFYEQYWVKMESLFTTETFDDFIRHYLMMKEHKTINKNRLYPSYKKFFTEINYNSEQALADLTNYAIMYSKLVQAKTNIETFDEIIAHINIMDSRVVYPYLLMLLGMHEKNEISTQELTTIGKLIESYLFRLKFCSGKTNGVNRIIVSLCDKKKVKNNWIQRTLDMLDTSFPSDKEFVKSIKTSNIYKQSKLAKFALMSLEEAKTKETIKFDDAQIEHIMPQRLTNDWRIEVDHAMKVNEELGGVIGNLTLTKYNQEMSNKIYREKRKFYQDSNISLTRDIAQDYDKWDRDSIVDRTEKISHKLVNIFPKPNFEANTKEKLSGEHLISEEINVTNTKPSRITINNEDINLDSWKKMLVVFMDYIWDLDSRSYEKIRQDSALGKMLFENQSRPELLKSGISIETNFSSGTILAIISKISDMYDISDEVSYTIK